MKHITHILSVLFVYFNLTACSNNEISLKKKQISNSDNVSILSIIPSTMQSLYVGQEYEFEIVVEYTFSARVGELGLVIQRSESEYQPISYSSQRILKNKGQLTLKAKITVPETKAIKVFIPLTTNGDNSTSVVSVKNYNVINKHK